MSDECVRAARLEQVRARVRASVARCAAKRCVVSWTTDPAIADWLAGLDDWRERVAEWSDAIAESEDP